jgi:GAF domain-containing protein
VWQSDEIAFAGELADQFAQVINNHNRRTATSALHLFQRAVEQSANAFLLVNCDGVVEYVNPSFTAITQYSTEEVHGHRCPNCRRWRTSANCCSTRPRA